MELLWQIERHLRRTGTTASEFGRKVMNDAKFVREVRLGRIPRDRTAARVRAAIAAVEAERAR